MHLFDAKANRCVQSWTEDELHGSAALNEGTEGVQQPQPHDAPSADDSHGHFHRVYEILMAFMKWFSHALSWSQDGRRLAVASKASLTCGARCSVLCF